MTVIELNNKFEKFGYVVSEYSGWVGDRGKYFFGKSNGFTVGSINVEKKEINAIHGYCGGYLKDVAKHFDYKLIEC